MIKAAIFDMDGLMFDTEPVMSKSYELLIKEYGKEPIFDPQTGLVHEVGQGKVLTNLIKTKHDIEEDVEILRCKRRVIFRQLLEDGILEIMPGILDLLKLLKNKKVKIGLASNSSERGILYNLEKSNIRKYFNEIISGEHVQNYKPYPDVYIEAAKRLGLLPCDCLAFEDTEYGVESAYKAGMKVIAVPSKYTHHQDFSNADLIINSLEDITWQKIEALFNH